MNLIFKVSILTFLCSVLSQIAIAQDADKTITITASGSGKTQDEARKMALRSAIEQAFGMFISSKTEILNDNLVKDEIVSVTNGNIQKFDVLSEVQIPNVGFASTLKAIVSVSKLTSFCVSKGVTVEFKGSTFAMNIKLQKLNEEAEYKAILNLCEVSKEILSKSIDFSFTLSEPVSCRDNGWTIPIPSKDDFSLKFEVQCKSNQNLKSFYDYFWNTMSKIGMSPDERLNYNKINKKSYFLLKGDNSGYLGGGSNGRVVAIDTISLRHNESLLLLKNLVIKSNDILLNFRLLSAVDTIFVKKCCENYSDEPPRTNNLHGGKDNNANEHTDNWELLIDGYPHFSLVKGVQAVQTFPVYFDFLTQINDHKQIFSYENYFTSSDLLKYMDNPFHRDYEYLELLSNSSYPLLMFKDMGPQNFILKYNHIISLSKLEKISGYKIEPWENKNPQILNLKDSPEWLKWFSANLKQGSDRNKVIKTLIENNFSKKSISDAEIKFIDLGLNIKEYPEWNNWFLNSLKMNADRNEIIEKLFENGFSEKSIIEAGKDFNFIRTKYGCYEYTRGKKD